jgi:epoxyqueuosine reductase QueG
MAVEGLEVYATVGGALLQQYFDSLEPGVRERYAADGVSTAIVVALPYDPRPQSSLQSKLDQSPMLGIGAFAAEHRYATLVRLLGGVARRLAGETGLSPKAFRIAVNSRLPEKELAALAGLGWIGRSTLLVTRAYGPACILGVLSLPAAFPMPSGTRESKASDASGLCAGCSACVDACPTGAIRPGIDSQPGIDLGRCIQYWASTEGTVPPDVRAAWGHRLYGCDECVAACPYSAAVWIRGEEGASPAERAASLALELERRPGYRVSADWVRLAPEAELRAFFRKTALGLSWLPPDLLRRNACIACGLPVQTFDENKLTD